MRKSEITDLYDPLLKQHVCDLLLYYGPLTFRQLRLHVMESFSVGALMPTLQEMLDEGKLKFNEGGRLEPV